MREIKFRVWDDLNKKMYPVSSINFDDKNVLVWGTDKEYPVIFKLKEENLMQYIGLKDKNNKEIYEGDILLLNDKNSLDYRPEKKYYCIVKWNYNGYECFWMDGSDSFIIIDNIYQNPEFLNEKNN